MEAVGRGGGAAGPPVAGGERARDVFGPPMSQPDELQCADNYANLVVEKRTGARLDMNLVAGLAELERVERLERRLGLAQRVAETREVMMADQVPRTRTHCLDIERRGDMPDPSPFKRRRCSAVEDAIEISSTGCREPRVERSGHRLYGEDRDPGGPQMVVNGAAQDLRQNRAGKIDMTGLRQRMHTRIGAPGAMHRDALAAELGDGGFERLLNRGPVGLPLPAGQSTPVIFYRQLIAGHGSTVPGVIGKPRKKAGVSSGARPGRCTRSNRNTPSPQATDKCSSSTVPGTPPAGPGKSMAAWTRMRSAPVSKKAPGQTSSARTRRSNSSDGSAQSRRPSSRRILGAWVTPSRGCGRATSRPSATPSSAARSSLP